jgi:hypothetical protein
MNKKSTKYANLGSKTCKPNLKPLAFCGIQTEVAGVTDPPQYLQAIDFVYHLKIVCNKNISMNTHEYPRICKPMGKYRENFKDCF